MLENLNRGILARGLAMTRRSFLFRSCLMFLVCGASSRGDTAPVGLALRRQVFAPAELIGQLKSAAWPFKSSTPNTHLALNESSSSSRGSWLITFCV
jgi:hypothetical protein